MTKRKIYIAIAAALTVASLVLGIRAWNLMTPTPTTVDTAPTPSSSTSTPSALAAEPTPGAPPAPSELAIVVTAEMAYSPTLTPPNFVDVFQLVDTEHGYLRTSGTTYLVAHSYAKGYGAPGNAWEELVVGDTFTQGGSLWQVDRVATPGHGDIADQPVWTNDPELIVLITCLSRGPGNPATNNYLISGHRLGSAP